MGSLWEPGFVENFPKKYSALKIANVMCSMFGDDPRISFLIMRTVPKKIRRGDCGPADILGIYTTQRPGSSGPGSRLVVSENEIRSIGRLWATKSFIAVKERDFTSLPSWLGARAPHARGAEAELTLL